MFLLRNDRRRPSVFEPDTQRFVSKSRKQWLGHRAHLQNAQKSDVQLGYPIQKEAHPLAGENSEAGQEMGDSVGADTKIVIREALLVALIFFPEQRRLLCQAQLAQAVAAHPTDVDHIARPIA